jgi:MFS family permease
VNGARNRVTLIVIVAAAVLIGLNATMLSVALPSVVSDLGATSVQATWMLLSYLVVSGGGLVVGGQLADSLDPGRIFRIGLGTFTMASVALAAVDDPTAFIGARAVQGAGAALLLSSAAAIIAIGHPAEGRRWAMGLYLAGFSIAQVSGPMIGGVVTSGLGWRWQFVISVALGAASLAVGWGPLGRLRGAVARGLRLDVAGNVLIVVMMTLSLVAFAGVQRLGWADPRTLVPLVVVVVLGPVFVVVEHRVRWPAVAVDLLRDPDFVLANLAAFCLCVARVVPALVLSLWFQGLVGDSPVVAAAKITPLAAAVTVGTLLVGRVARGAGDLAVARTCAFATVLGTTMVLAAVLVGDDLVLVVAGLVVTGLATGAFQTVNSTMILGMRPVSRAATVNGIRATAQQAGVSVGTALLISLAAGGLAPADASAFFAGRAGDLDAAARVALRTGYAVSLSVLVLLCLVGLLASLALSRRRTLQGSDLLISAPKPLVK